MPLYVCYVELFGDDVSGAVSKEWNKHYCVFMTQRNLPREILSYNYFVHFVCTSKTYTIPEQLASVSKLIGDTHARPMTVGDALDKRHVRLRDEIVSIVSDNPMASEIIDHIGQKGNHFCHRCDIGICDIGGTLETRQSDKGFHNLFSPGPGGTKAQSLMHLKNQAILAMTVELKMPKAKLTQGRKNKNWNQGTILHRKVDFFGD